jgi:hypothetical protein
MYFQESERVGDYGEETSYQGPPLGAAVLALPAGVVAAAIAALEALLFVLTAIAAAYLPHRALEKAKSMGIGVAWAEEKLLVAFNWVITQAKRGIKALRDAIDKAGKQNLPPNCQNFVQILVQQLQRLEGLLARPDFANKAAWLEELKSAIDAARRILDAFINECLKA